MYSKVSDKLNRFKNGLRQYGPEYLIYCITSRLPGWFLGYHHTYLLTARELNLNISAEDGLDVRFASHDDIMRSKITAVDRQKSSQRFRNGSKCAVVYSRGKMVSIGWAAVGRIFTRQAGSVIDTKNDGVYVYDVYSLPEERGKGFYRACLKLISDFYSLHQRSRKYVIIDVLNSDSINAHIRLGFRVCGESIHVVLGGINICFYKKWPQKKSRFHIFLKKPPGNSREV